MQHDQFHHRCSDIHTAFVHRWTPDASKAPARAIVQIVHGMAEHGARYARLAQALVAAGYAVYAQDLPGHGRSVRAADELGHVDDTEGWTQTLAAINAVRSLAEREQRGAPLFLLGHSRGSFLLQDYVIEHGRGLAGAIFSAGNGDLGPLRAIGTGLLRLEALWHGRAHRSAIADHLTFKDFNRRFKPARTDFDWLSRDAAEVDAYVADPLCGFRCSCALWLELMAMGARMDDPQRLARVPKNLPVLLINGEDDPACRGATGARALERIYREAGLDDVALKLYAGARHELLNDTCREQVTRDLSRWIGEHLR
ncbi:MAG TPA: alpha/beta hydrolase [Solimonas sp.]